MPRKAPLPLLAHAPAAAGPQYRFWGAQKPPQGRQRIRAQVASTSDGDDVATIRVYAPIDSWGGDWGISANEFAAALDEIPNAPQIQLHINSPGGEVWEAIAILNQLRDHPADVTAIVDGLAASAASFLAAGADTTVMGQNAQLMIHDAWGLCVGNAADMHGLADVLDQVSDNIASIYQAKAGGTVADWRNAMLKESRYGADQAVAAGLADRISGDDEADADEGAQNRYDLSQLRHQARARPAARTSAIAAGAPAPSTDVRRRFEARRLALAAQRHGLPLPARAELAPDTSMLTQAMAWFTAVDNIVDEAQEALAGYLGVPSPDPDDADDTATAG